MTEPRFLLDSNICIYVLEGSSTAARARIEIHAPGELVTSAIAYAEVMRGVRIERADDRRKAAAFFDLVQVRPFDAAAALAYRTLPFRRGTFDRLIAAHALALGLVLVTNNEGDFDDVAGLRVQNWTVE